MYIVLDLFHILGCYLYRIYGMQINSIQFKDLNLEIYYNQFCKILVRVIIVARKAHYNRMILKSNNKMKSTWRIINEKGRNKRIHSTIIGGKKKK
jgi:hypothetical protein